MKPKTRAGKWLPTISAVHSSKRVIRESAQRCCTPQELQRSYHLSSYSRWFTGTHLEASTNLSFAPFPSVKIVPGNNGFSCSATLQLVLEFTESDTKLSWRGILGNALADFSVMML